MSDSKLKDIGQNILNDVSPVQPTRDLLVSVGEILQDGLPKPLVNAITNKNLPGRFGVISTLAREYLTYIFGVKPLINDIKALASTAHKVDQMVSQWIRNNHRDVRRRRRLAVEKVPTYKTWSGKGNSSYRYGYVPPSSAAEKSQGYRTYGSSTNFGFNAAGFMEKSSMLTTKVSFSSSFEYDLSKMLPSKLGLKFLDLDESSLRDQLELHVFGLAQSDISGSLVWNLLPYSWLVDWFTNIGNILDTVRNFQSAGMQVNWAYVKVVQEYFQKYRFFGEITSAAAIASNTSPIRYTVASKQLYVRRLRATPFGFQVGFDQLSASQLSILGALAMR